MNGAFHAPPLTVPSVFADRQSRRESPKMASRPFQFLEKNAPKSERERPSTLRDWPPCPPIQRDGGWRSRPGVNPFISALTVTRCLADFPGVWPQLRDILVCTPSSRQRNNLHFTHENPSCIPYGAGCYAASRRSWTSIGVRTPRPRWRRWKL